MKLMRERRLIGYGMWNLASTLAKNATKPNPFKIIPLQTARTENNWKT
jgi:hypothetical protein